MSGMVHTLVLVFGLPFMVLLMIGLVWEAPYLILVLLYFAHLLRKAYRRADASFQRDVAAARVRLEAQAAGMPACACCGGVACRAVTTGGTRIGPGA